MDEMQLLAEFHRNTPRQGPGSDSETRKALELIGVSKTERIEILDVGCGSGSQTMTLAESTNAAITAVDLFPVFLDRLVETARTRGLGDRIKTLACSMDELPFEERAFDVIWSEGAIYNIGFEHGMRTWRRYLKEKGSIAVTELSWITAERPMELEDYWRREYPGIGAISDKIKIIENSGYRPIGAFVLPADCWMENYYEPMRKMFDAFRKKHNSAEAERMIRHEQEEIEVFEKYQDFFSYVFYIAQRF
jgi:ubiquinone/menaquinone biosynthesis C-methylase UbiE